MRFPGFTADASLVKHQGRYDAHSRNRMHELSWRRSVEPAIRGPGRKSIKPAYRTVGLRDSATVFSCARRIRAQIPPGSMSTPGSTPSPPTVTCPPGNQAARCPDGTEGCCPTYAPKCFSFGGLLGNKCVPF